MSLKKTFTTGLLTLLPITITVYVFYLVFSALDNALGSIFEAILGMRIPGLGFLVGILLIFLVGSVASNFIGRRMISLGERILEQIPVARGIYRGVKQILDAFSLQKQLFQRVVLLEYPRKGLFVIGFVTGISRGEVQCKTHTEMVNVFVPTTPNPTSGVLVLVPRDEIIDLSMSVEDGMKLIISGGLVTPPSSEALLPAPEPGGSAGEAGSR